MRTLLFSFILLISIPVASAQSRPELSEAMKVIGGHFRTVAVSLRSQIIDDSTVQAASGLVSAIELAAAIMPATAPDESSQQRYLQLMDELKQKSQELLLAAESGDFDTLALVFREMNEIRMLGHEEFKPLDN